MGFASVGPNQGWFFLQRDGSHASEEVSHLENPKADLCVWVGRSVDHCYDRDGAHCLSSAVLQARDF
jgi:hypothetical protein